MRHRGLDPDDVIIAEYPKSGSTWFAFMLGEVVFRQPVDFENQGTIVPGVGSHRLAPRVSASIGRLVRTHERHRREYRRSIYLVRHVGDVALSYFHWLHWRLGTGGTFKDFLPRFISGRLDSYGPWHSHVSSWLDAQDGDRIIVRYEDLRKEAPETIQRVLSFLDLEVDPMAIEAAVANNSLDRMRAKQEKARATVFKNRDESGSFVRQGKAGTWKEQLDPEDVELLYEISRPVLRRLGYDA